MSRPHSLEACLRLLVALTALGGMPASAGTAYEARGNALTPDSFTAAGDVDERGLTQLRPTRRRTPSGFLYPYPLRPRPFHSLFDDRVLLRGSLEAGYLENVGDADEARFREYSDWSDGFLLRSFSLDARQADGPAYLELGGGSVARDDQFYHAELGSFGLLRVRGFYDSLRHVYADDARVLYSGAGSEQLTLPPALVPGMSTPAEIQSALAGVGESRLSQKRSASGVELALRILPELTLQASYQNQHKDGKRAFGGTLGLTFNTAFAGSVVETLEPIRSDTHDWSAGLAYATERVQLNLSYRGSAFDNHHSSLTWENPFPNFDNGMVVLVPGPPQGRSALPPDNWLHQVSTDLGFSLPASGRFTASAVFTRMSQDQRLLPATINGAITTFDALPRTHADAQVDHLLVRSQLRLRPLRALALTARFRFFQRQNDTDYQALNPTSGLYGYVVEDTSVDLRVGAVPFDSRRWSAEGSVDWSVARHCKLGLEYQHESTRRDNRSRNTVNDDLARIYLSTRALPRTTVRLSYEYSSRGGSSYDTSRDHAFYTDTPGSALLAGPERSLRQFRQLDLASYARHSVDLKANWLLGERADLSLIGRLKTTDFRSSYGVKDELGADLNLDARYQLSPELDADAFVSFDWRDRTLDSINSQPGPGVDFDAGGAVFPFANRWSWDAETRTVAAGAGLHARPLERLGLGADYRFLWSDEEDDTDFQSTGGALPPSVDPATARRRFPGLRIVDHVLDVFAEFRWTEHLDTRVFYRLQRSTIEDFQQEGLVPLVNHNLYLAAVDDDFTAHVVGATLRLRY